MGIDEVVVNGLALLGRDWVSGKTELMRGEREREREKGEGEEGAKQDLPESLRFSGLTIYYLELMLL